MSIYIKGMDMPENCFYDCPLFSQIPPDEDHALLNYCVLEKWRQSCTPTPFTVEEAKSGIQPWCPLIPVPPNVRLIDANALAGRIEHERFHHTHTDALAARHHTAEYGHFLKAIVEAPTLIPEDKEE